MTVPVGECQAARLRIVLQKCCSFPVLLGAMLVLVNFAIESSFRIDPDTWMHIKLGQGILETGRWPTGDVYSFTASGVFRMAFEWVGEVVMALAWRWGGSRGMEALLILLTTAIVLLVYYYAYLRCSNWKASFLATALAVPLAALEFTLRPQLLGYAFLLITLICLERFRKGEQKTLWVLAPLFLIWVNTHGSFALGCFVLGVYWVSGLFAFTLGGLEGQPWTDNQRRHVALVSLLCLLALTITPYGTRLAAYPIDMAFSQPVGVASVQEWQSMPFNLLQGKLFILLAFGFVVAHAAFRPAWRLEEMILFLFAVYSSCLHCRFIIFFAIVSAPLLGSLLARWVPRYDSSIDKYALNAALVGVALIIMVRYFPSEAKLDKKVAEDYPVKAVEYLRHHPVPRPMFNDYSFGGYLLWSMGPEHKVFIDGRADLYEYAGAFADYNDIMALKPTTEFLLRKYAVQSCLIQRNAPLATLLAALPGWKQIYTDDVSVLLTRNPQPSASGSAK